MGVVLMWARCEPRLTVRLTQKSHRPDSAEFTEIKLHSLKVRLILSKILLDGVVSHSRKAINDSQRDYASTN